VYNHYLSSTETDPQTSELELHMYLFRDQKRYLPLEVPGCHNNYIVLIYQDGTLTLGRHGSLGADGPDGTRFHRDQTVVTLDTLDGDTELNRIAKLLIKHQAILSLSR
jgi:hypothetical protein